MVRQFYRNTLLWAVGVLAMAFIGGKAAHGQKHSATSAHTSYTGLAMTGYQGWFGTPQDGVTNSWRHYRGRSGFRPGSASIEYWPDMREAEADEKYRTEFVFADGSPAYVFSSVHPKTVDRHFRWMKEYGIDGAFMQRFRSDFGLRRTLDVILGNALAAARRQGRALALMYDIGANIHRDGVPDEARRTTEVRMIFDDWQTLVDELGLTTGGDDQPYLYHNGKPLVVLWGVGFNHRHNATGLDVQYWVELVDLLQNDPEYGGCSIMLGVPTNWRTGGGDCISGAEHAKMLELIKKVDIVQPWHTSRFGRDQMGTRFKGIVSSDIAWCQSNGVGYVPTISPGIREKILHGNDYERPREGGRYFWDMARAAIEAGSQMLYLGMFDEVDEGTQYHKINNNPPFYSDGLSFADYGDDPEDHYLWLAGEAKRALTGEFVMGANFRQRADVAAFRSEVVFIDQGAAYEMRLDAAVPGRRLFYAEPYAVPDGAPTVGTGRDRDLFAHELVDAASFGPEQRSGYLRLVEVDAEDKVLAYKAVVGAPGYAPVPYATSFEDGRIDRRYWTTAGEGVAVAEDAGAKSGDYQLLLAGGGDAGVGADLHVNVEGLADDLTLRFAVKRTAGEAAARDGVYFSNDGGERFVKVYDFDGTPGEYAEIALNMNQLAADAGLGFSSRFIVRFWHGSGQVAIALDDVGIERPLMPPGDVLQNYNGGFESGLAFWRFFEVPERLGSTAEIIREDVADETHAVKITFAEAAPGLRDRALDNWDAGMVMQPGVAYSARFAAKAETPTDGALLLAYGFFDEEKQVIAESRASFELTDQYREYETVFTAPPGTVSGWLAFRWKDASGDRYMPGVVYLDKVQLLPSDQGTAIEDRGALPVSFGLGQNYPNPFNPRTTIGFSLPQAAAVKLVVYNVQGQLVQALADGRLEAGTHRVAWDGRDSTGKGLATGIYFYRLETAYGAQGRKMVLVK